QRHPPPSPPTAPGQNPGDPCWTTWSTATRHPHCSERLWLTSHALYHQCDLIVEVFPADLRRPQGFIRPTFMAATVSWCGSSCAGCHGVARCSVSALTRSGHKGCGTGDAIALGTATRAPPGELPPPTGVTHGLP